jgi:membrane AbrB-like protein
MTDEDGFLRALATRPAWLRWTVLLAASLLIVALLEAAHLSAALLLGSMVAAIVLAVGGASVRVPGPAFAVAQGVLGVMIARYIPVSIVGEIARQGPLFIGCVVSVIVAALLLGLLLMRWRVLPGTTALWGTFPGAASAMVLMSGAFGGDMRLVAFMQYLRVVLVAVVASVMARLWQGPGKHVAVASTDWLALGEPRALALTLLLVLATVWLAARTRLPAGALLLPLVAGVVLEDSGLLHITLPPLLLAACYALLGWSIGEHFTPQILRSALKALPRMLGAIVALIALCGAIAVALVKLAGIDPLTAYLATSPGGADSVAIIAASSRQVDVPFVMAMQTARLVVVLVCGPVLARWLGRRFGAPLA